MPHYLWLVMYWQLTLSDKLRKWWAEYKNTSSYIARAPFPFRRFRAFLPPPSPTPLFLRLPRRLDIIGFYILLEQQ